MKKPFFAKYLESQKSDETDDKEQDTPREGLKTGIRAGARRTLKYPSDRDEFVTLKYPSDDDEGGTDI